MPEYTKESLFEIKCSNGLSLWHNRLTLFLNFSMIGDYLKEFSTRKSIEVNFTSEEVASVLKFTDTLIIPRSNQGLLSLLIVSGYLGLNNKHTDILITKIFKWFKQTRKVETIEKITIQELIEKLRDPEYLCERERKEKEDTSWDPSRIYKMTDSPEPIVMMGPPGPQGPPGPPCPCKCCQ